MHAGLRKKMNVSDASYIIKSLSSNEFIIGFPSNFDLRCTFDTAEKREDFLNLVKLRYAHIQPKSTLKVYGVVRL